MARLQVTKADVQRFVPGADDDVVDALLTGTMARVRLLAPCLAGDGLTADQAAVARDLVQQIVVRAIEEGSGATTTVIAGPMQQTMDTTQRRSARFRPDEIRELQQLCGIRRGGAFTIALAY